MERVACPLCCASEEAGWRVHAYWEDSFEAVVEAAFDIMPLATDPTRARYRALESFLQVLNDEDALILIAFNETGMRVACEIPGNPNADEGTKLAECLSSNRDLILAEAPSTSKSALDKLMGEEQGRTPLWSTIEMVYPYMQGLTPEGQAAGVNKFKLRHLLVIGDGPDTCAQSPEQNQCTGGCPAYSTTHETVREMIEADPMADRIPIHFVQMAAKGYPERDPRQQEIACLTGGQYSFVNTMNITSQALEDVLTETIRNIRYTFRGYWRFQIPLGIAKKANNPSPGWLYGISGGGARCYLAPRAYSSRATTTSSSRSSRT